MTVFYLTFTIARTGMCTYMHTTQCISIARSVRNASWYNNDFDSRTVTVVSLSNGLHCISVRPPSNTLHERDNTCTVFSDSIFNNKINKAGVCVCF